jgi:hypothetical protein
MFRQKELIYTKSFDNNKDYLSYNGSFYYIKKISREVLNDALTSLETNGNQTDLNGRYFLFDKNNNLCVVEYIAQEGMYQPPTLRFQCLLMVGQEDRKLAPRWFVNMRKTFAYDADEHDEYDDTENINDARIYSCDVLNLPDTDEMDDLLEILRQTRYVFSSHDESRVVPLIASRKGYTGLLPTGYINEFIEIKPRGKPRGGGITKKRRRLKLKKMKKTKKTKRTKNIRKKI